MSEGPTMPHLSPELVQMVLQGELPPRTLVTLVRHHLADLCPHCRQAFAEIEHGGAVTFAARHSGACSLEGYASAFERAAGKAIEEAGRLNDQRGNAAGELRRLLATPIGERQGLLSRAYRRYRSRPLAERLVAESARRVRQDPEEAASLAEVAHQVLLRIPGAHATLWAEGLAARALAHRANALRAGGDLPAADRLFRRLRARLASHPIDDPEVHAEVSSLEASLRQDQRRFDEAENLLARAVLLHRQASSSAGVAKALVQKSAVHRGQGDPETALACLEEATAVLAAGGGREAEGDLYLCALGNRALCLCDLGRHREAADLVAAHRALYAAADDGWARPRLAWLEGRIAHGLGEPVAEALLRRARDGFLAAGNEFNATLVSLDLALVLFEEGRHGELKELAAELTSAFHARQAGQEEVAALILFQQAVVAERVSAEAIRRLRGALERRGEGIALRLPPPS